MTKERATPANLKPEPPYLRPQERQKYLDSRLKISGMTEGYSGNDKKGDIRE